MIVRMNDIICSVEEKDGELFVDNRQIKTNVNCIVREYDKFKHSVDSLESLLDQKTSQLKDLQILLNKLDVSEGECIVFMKKAGKDLELLKNKPSDREVYKIAESWRSSGYTKGKMLKRDALIDTIKDNIKYVMEQESSMKQLVSSINKIKDELSLLSAKISKSNGYMKEIQTQSGDLFDIILDYEQRRQTIGKQEDKQLLTQIKSLRSECVNVIIKFRRETQSEMNNEIEALHEKIDGLDTELRDSNNEIKTLQTDLNYLIDANEQLTEDKKELVDISSAILDTLTSLLEETKDSRVGNVLSEQIEKLIEKIG